MTSILKKFAGIAFISLLALAFNALSTPAKAQVVANFSYSPPGSVPATVYFTDMSTSGASTGIISSRNWDFGDGSPISNISNPAHIYSVPGTYTVMLSVVTSTGATDVVSKALVVQPAATPPTSVYATNMGTEFWVGYGHNQYMETGANTQNMRLYISTGSQPAVVTVTLDSSHTLPASWFKRTYNIPANSFISTENLPKGTVNAASSVSDPNYDARLFSDPPPSGSSSVGVFRKKGIHIESDVPITAQAHIYGGVSAGMTTLLPVNSWGYSYRSLNSQQADAGGPGFSWFYVIAKEDNTKIEITPSYDSRTGHPVGNTFSVQLAKGQIYQLLAQADAAGNGGSFTGSVIKSIPGTDGKYHPIAVFGGSSRTRGESVPCGAGSGRDNDIQQLFPVRNWGRSYLTAPLSTASGTSSAVTLNATTFQTSVYKIVVSDPTTVVAKNSALLSGLINNHYYIYSSNTADRIMSDKPIMVGQFMSGSSTCNPGSHGDPDMVPLTPLDCGVNEAIFVRTTTQAIYANYLTLLVPTPGLASLTIDGSAVFNHSFAHPNKVGYSVVIKGWQAAQAQCNVKCDSPFTALSYGLGGAESYLFNAGMKIKIADTLRKIICPGSTSGILSSDISGTVYQWELNTGSGFTPITDGFYYSGSTTSTLQLQNMSPAWDGYQYRVFVDGEVGTIYTIRIANEWTGAVDNAWETPGNWKCGAPPAATDHVIIPGTANVLLSSNVTVKTLTLEPGAVFTVAPGYTITITN